ncbi:MAG: hypothetical protein HYS23_00465 [Geobacter sp.]|nr:hypothetical protein [Geobacter sp.]
MKSKIRVLGIKVGICLFGIVPVAHAVNFVDTPGAAMKDHAVDVDSIRKGDDGLVYFTEKNPMGLYDRAVNCQERISYTLSFKEPQKYPDWRSKGQKIVPRSYGALLADFVCSRAC